MKAAAYFVLIYTGVRIAARLKDKFGHLVAVGIVTILTLQVTINVSMTMGLSPVVGITLPFISYGGTALLFNSLGVGILMSISRHKTQALEKSAFPDIIDGTRA